MILMSGNYVWKSSCEFSDYWLYTGFFLENLTQVSQRSWQPLRQLPYQSLLLHGQVISNFSSPQSSGVNALFIVLYRIILKKHFVPVRLLLQLTLKTVETQSWYCLIVKQCVIYSKIPQDDSLCILVMSMGSSLSYWSPLWSTAL